MKKFLIGIFLSILFFMQTFSQIDTTNLSFYPLNEGDYWEYYERIDENIVWPPYISIEYYSQEVIGDSLLPIGKIYKVIERKKLGSSQPPVYIFERIDSITCNVYRYDDYSNTEYLIDSLKSVTGDSCNAGRFGFVEGTFKNYCTLFQADTLFQLLPVIIKEFNEPKLFFPCTYRLASGIGLTQIDIQYCFGTFSSRLVCAVIDSIAYGTKVNSIPNQNVVVLKDIYLYQNYPNPFNSTTIISFGVPQKSKVDITIYDINGRKINTLLSTEMNQGSHSISWDGTNQYGESVASGVYIYLLKAISSNKSFIKLKKLLILR